MCDKTTTGYLVTCSDCFLIESFLDDFQAKRFMEEMRADGHDPNIKEAEFDE